MLRPDTSSSQTNTRFSTLQLSPEVVRRAEEHGRSHNHGSLLSGAWPRAHMSDLWCAGVCRSHSPRPPRSTAGRVCPLSQFLSRPQHFPANPTDSSSLTTLSSVSPSSPSGHHCWSGWARLCCGKALFMACSNRRLLLSHAGCPSGPSRALLILEAWGPG